MKKQKLIGLAALILTLQGTASANHLERSVRLDDSLSHSLRHVEQFKEAPADAGKSMADSFVGTGVNFEVAVESTTIKKIRSREELSQLPGAPAAYKIRVEEKQSFGHKAKTLLVSSAKSFVTAVSIFVKKLVSCFSI